MPPDAVSGKTGDRKRNSGTAGVGGDQVFGDIADGGRIRQLDVRGHSSANDDRCIGGHVDVDSFVLIDLDHQGMIGALRGVHAQFMRAANQHHLKLAGCIGLDLLLVNPDFSMRDRCSVGEEDTALKDIADSARLRGGQSRGEDVLGENGDGREDKCQRDGCGNPDAEKHVVPDREGQE